MDRRFSDATLAEKGLDRWGFPLPLALRIVRKPDLPKQQGIGSFTNDKLVAGLRKLCSEREEGQTFTLQEIADVCDVSVGTIRLLEMKALLKIRRRLSPAVQKQAIELLRTKFIE